MLQNIMIQFLNLTQMQRVFQKLAIFVSVEAAQGLMECLW